MGESRGEEWGRLLQCRATKQHHGAAADTVCLYVCLYVQFVYIFKWTLFTSAFEFVCRDVYTHLLHLYNDVNVYMYVCVCVSVSDDQLNHNYLSCPNTKASAAMHHDF